VCNRHTSNDLLWCVMCDLCRVLQAAELRSQHAAELDALHLRLQDVLARKDGTIAQLQSDLNATLAKLQQATRELMGDED